MRTTRTYATMEVSRGAYDEIAEKLRAAGYDHAFLEGGALDLHGVAVVPEPPKPPKPPAVKRIRFSFSRVLDKEFPSREAAAEYVAALGGQLDSVTGPDGYSEEAIHHCEVCDGPIFDDDPEDSYTSDDDGDCYFHRACAGEPRSAR